MKTITATTITGVLYFLVVASDPNSTQALLFANLILCVGGIINSFFREEKINLAAMIVITGVIAISSKSSLTSYFRSPETPENLAKMGLNLNEFKWLSQPIKDKEGLERWKELAARFAEIGDTKKAKCFYQIANSPDESR